MNQNVSEQRQTVMAIARNPVGERIEGNVSEKRIAVENKSCHSTKFY